MYDIHSRKIPEDLEVTARSRDFTFEDTPEHFRTHHILPRWAQVIVEQGSIEFREPANDHHEEDISVILKAGESLVLMPHADHNAQPHEGALFHVEFYGDSDVPNIIPLGKR